MKDDYLMIPGHIQPLFTIKYMQFHISAENGYPWEHVSWNYKGVTLISQRALLLYCNGYL